MAPVRHHHPCGSHADRRRADPECTACERVCKRCCVKKPATSFRGRAACRLCHSVQVSGLTRERKRRVAQKGAEDRNGGREWPRDPVERALMLALWTTCNSHHDQPVLERWLEEVGRSLLKKFDRGALEARLVEISFVAEPAHLEQLIVTSCTGVPRWRCMDVIVHKNREERQLLVDMKNTWFAASPEARAAWEMGVAAWVRHCAVGDLVPLFPGEGTRPRMPLDFPRASDVMAPAVWEVRDDRCEARRIVCRAVHTLCATDPAWSPGRSVTWRQLTHTAPRIEDVLEDFAGIVRDKARLFADDSLRWVDRSSRWVGEDGKSGRLREIDVCLRQGSAASGATLLQALTDPEAILVDVVNVRDADERLDDAFVLRNELLRCAVELAQVCPGFGRAVTGPRGITLRTLERVTGWNRQSIQRLAGLMRAMPRIGVPPPEPLPELTAEERKAMTRPEREERERQEYLVQAPLHAAPLREFWCKGRWLVARPLPGAGPDEMLDPTNLGLLTPEEAGSVWPGYERVVGTGAVF